MSRMPWSIESACFVPCGRAIELDTHVTVLIGSLLDMVRPVTIQTEV